MRPKTGTARKVTGTKLVVRGPNPDHEAQTNERSSKRPKTSATADEHVSGTDDADASSPAVTKPSRADIHGTTVPLQHFSDMVLQVGKLQERVDALSEDVLRHKETNKLQVEEINRLKDEVRHLRAEREQKTVRQYSPPAAEPMTDEDEEMKEVEGELDDRVEALQTEMAQLQLQLETAQAEAQTKEDDMGVMRAELSASLVALADRDHLLDADIKFIQNFKEIWEARIKAYDGSADSQRWKQEMLSQIARLKGVHSILR